MLRTESQLDDRRRDGTAAQEPQPDAAPLAEQEGERAADDETELGRGRQRADRERDRRQQARDDADDDPPESARSQRERLGRHERADEEERRRDEGELRGRGGIRSEAHEREERRDGGREEVGEGRDRVPGAHDDEHPGHGDERQHRQGTHPPGGERPADGPDDEQTRSRRG